MPPDNEVRPRFPEGDDVVMNGWRADSESTGSVTVDGQVMTARDWAVWTDGWTHGRAEGIDHGRQLEHDEVATLQREAVRIVHELAKAPPRDADADRRRAERSAAWWAERRGEGGAA